MTLKDIEYVIAVAKYNSFSKAAENLYISQSALSQSIKKLEENLGVQFFKRTSTSISITEAGEFFVKKGKTILELSDDLEYQIKEMAHLGENIIRVGVSQFYGKFFFPKIIPNFNKKYPDTQIRIFEYLSKDLEKLLLEGEIDILVATLPINNSQLEYREFFKENIVLAAPKNKFLNVKSIDDTSILKNEKFILPVKELKIRKTIDKIFKSLDFEPDCILESKNFETINSFVAQKMGIAFIPSVVEHNPDVSYYKINSDSCTRNFAIVYKKSKKNHYIISEFIKTAKETMKDFTK